MARNLVTGGMGLLGIYLARELLAEGEEVILFQRRGELPSTAADIKDKSIVHAGDVRNWVQVLEAVRDHAIDTVYHAAALLTKDCEESAANGFRTNVVGTLNILEGARILGVKNVIFVSTGSTYGFKSHPKRILDDTPQKPETMYATTKVCCERLGEQYWRQYGLNFRAARFAVVVGPAKQHSYHFGDWSGIIERTALNEPYTAHSDPNIACAYIYVKDAVRALVGLKKADESKLRQRVYNVHGFLATLAEVDQVLRKHIPGTRISFDWDRGEAMRAANEAVSYEMDNTSALQDFGYQTSYPLQEMVEDFIREVRAGRAA